MQYTVDYIDFDQSIADMVNYLLNAYLAIADYEAHKALLDLLESGCDSEYLVRTVTAAYDYFIAVYGEI